MDSPLEFVLAAALVVALIATFVLYRRTQTPPERPGNGGSGQHPGSRPFDPREKVDVHVDSTAERLRLRVEPWVVDVRNGKPLEWVLHASDPGATMRIQPKDSERWPFPAPPQRPPVPPGTPFEAGHVRGAVGSSWSYSIVVRIEGRDIDIDPEIFICY